MLEPFANNEPKHGSKKTKPNQSFKEIKIFNKNIVDISAKTKDFQQKHSCLNCQIVA